MGRLDLNFRPATLEVDAFTTGFVRDKRGRDCSVVNDININAVLRSDAERGQAFLRSVLAETETGFC